MKAEQLFDVRDRVVFITGAASGLGLAMAEVLSENGARVTMADINLDELNTQAERLSKDGGKIDQIKLDVGDPAQISAAINTTVEKFGRIDAVFANAGVSAGPSHLHPSGQLDAVTVEEWERVVHINMTSVFATVQAAATHMKRQKEGRIVVTGSVSGLASDDLVGYAYTATKAGVINFVRQAAKEFAPHNVLINAIAPGPFLTNIADGRLKEP